MNQRPQSRADAAKIRFVRDAALREARPAELLTDFIKTPVWTELLEPMLAVDINNFEKHLTRNGTLVLKFFLHVSKGEQKKRFLERLTNPEKHWKFSEADMAEREHWKDYQSAFEDALTATSTKRAPWWVIPADRKYVARAIVADVITTAIQDLDLKYPEVTEDKMARITAARAKLEKNKNDDEG